MKRLCVFGASITSGRDDPEGGWCDRLKRSLFDKGIFVFNLGISGDDTDDLLFRLDNECKARGPDSILIALGGNDSNYIDGFRVPLEDFKHNLVEIFKICRRYADEVKVAGLTQVNEKNLASELQGRINNENLKLYDQAIKDLAEKQGIPFIPTFDLELSYTDGLHPDIQGHQVLFERIKDHI